jgi:hypothetical protein
MSLPTGHHACASSRARSGAAPVGAAPLAIRSNAHSTRNHCAGHDRADSQQRHDEVRDDHECHSHAHPIPTRRTNTQDGKSVSRATEVLRTAATLEPPQDQKRAGVEGICRLWTARGHRTSRMGRGLNPRRVARRFAEGDLDWFLVSADVFCRRPFPSVPPSNAGQHRDCCCVSHRGWLRRAENRPPARWLAA